MDYGALIRDAWRTTWRYRFLWLIGLFAGGAAGIPSGGNGVQWQMGNEDIERASPQMQRFAEGVATWTVQNIGFLIFAGAMLLLLGLVLLIMWLIAQGGMAEATVDLAEGRQATFGTAWATGVHLFWRYAGLWLLLMVAAFVIAAVVATGIALIGALAYAAGDVGILVPVVVLFGLAALLAGIFAAIAITIVISFAQRAIFDRNVGPLDALRIGWEMVRDHPGTSVLVWLINVALAIGAGIAVSIALVAVAAVLAVPGAALWAAAGFNGAMVAYITLAVVVIIAAAIGLLGITNTFFWNYWTLAYLRLSQ